jgi:hypothetical protein
MKEKNYLRRIRLRDPMHSSPSAITDVTSIVTYQRLYVSVSITNCVDSR